MKCLKLYAVALLTVTGVSTFALTANAEEGTGTNKQETSTAKLAVTGADENSESEIIDEDLDDKDDENNNQTGQKGPLTLDLVPNFNFGTEAIKAEGNVLAVNKEHKLAVQVSDQRGTGAGWNLTLGLSDFVNLDQDASEKAAVLKGISLATGIVSQKTTANNPNKESAPEMPEITLIPGEDDVIYQAAAEAGLGTWLGYFAENNQAKTSLTIPAGNYVGEYAATLTWTLENAPK